MKNLAKTRWDTWVGIATIISCVVAVVTYFSLSTEDSLEPSVSFSGVTGDNSTQIGSVYGPVTINNSNADVNHGVSEKQQRISYNIYRGVTEAFIVYNKDGLLGMQGIVDECYSVVSKESEMGDVERCFSMDLAAHYWDESVADFANFPRYEYFSEENIFKRLESAFRKQGSSRDYWENFVFKIWIPQIQTQFDETIDKNAPR